MEGDIPVASMEEKNGEVELKVEKGERRKGN